jgi:hypothetical protein
MTVYKRKNGILVDANGTPMELPKRGEVCVPFIVSDIPDYVSPVDGRLISGRAQRREDLKRNNCVEYEPSMSPTKGKREFKNARFAKKHGLKLSEEARS